MNRGHFDILFILQYFSAILCWETISWFLRFVWKMKKKILIDHHYKRSCQNTRVFWCCRICRNRLMFLQGARGHPIESCFFATEYFGTRIQWIPRKLFGKNSIVLTNYLDVDLLSNLLAWWRKLEYLKSYFVSYFTTCCHNSFSECNSY